MYYLKLFIAFSAIGVYFQTYGQQIKLVQTNTGKVELHDVLMDKYILDAYPFKDLKAVFNRFTNDNAGYRVKKHDSVEIFFVFGNFKDSLKECVNNISFHYDGQNQEGIASYLGVKQFSGKIEKVAYTSSNSFVVSFYLSNYFRYAGHNGIILITQYFEYEFKTMDNKIVAIDVFESISSTDSTKNKPRHYTKRMLIGYDKFGMLAFQKFYKDTTEAPEVSLTYIFDSSGVLLKYFSQTYPCRNIACPITLNEVKYYYENGKLIYTVEVVRETGKPELDKEQLDSIYLLCINLKNGRKELELVRNDIKTSDEKDEFIKKRMDSLGSLFDEIKIRFEGYQIIRNVYVNGKLICKNRVRTNYSNDQQVENIDSLFYDNSGRILRYEGEYYATLYEYDNSTGKLSNKKEYLNKDKGDVRIEEWYSYDKSGKMVQIRISDYPNGSSKTLQFMYDH